MKYSWIASPRAWLYGALGLALVLIIACGSAQEAPAEPAVSEVASQSASEVAGISAEKAPPPAAQRQPSTGMAGGSGGSTSGTEAMGQSEAPAPTAVPAPTAAPPPEVVGRQVTRLEFAITSANNETNRPWKGSRQAYVQYDPTLEYAIGIHPTTSEYVPELATRWEANDDLSEWTFYLREGIPFHNGWGELTADDFQHTAEILTRPDTRLGTWRYFVGGRDDDGNPLAGPEQYFRKIDDHTFTIIFHGRDGNPATTFDAEFVMSNASSEMGAWSKDFWESAGPDVEAREKLLDEQGLQGTGSYQYMGREPAQAFLIEKIPGRHWSQDVGDLPEGVLPEDPDFQEIRIYWAPEDATRFANLLAGTAHMADLPLDLQKDAANRGMALMRSQFTANNFFVFFGGMYLSDDERDLAAYDPTVPWAETPWAGQDPPQKGQPGFENNGWKVRRAMNKAINREELLEQLYKGIGELMYVGYYHPSHYGWDPSWEQRYETEYKYNPEEAKQLLAEAGYGPDSDKTVKVTVQSYVSPGEAELPQAMEAIGNYWSQVGIDVVIEDLSASQVRERYRAREMQHRVWPNIIIYFPLEYGNLTGFTSTFGGSNHYQDNYTNAKASEWRSETDFDRRDALAREWGNWAFDNYMTMPLFWFPHTVVVDPEVVASWIYPGSTVPRNGHMHAIKATYQGG